MKILSMIPTVLILALLCACNAPLASDSSTPSISSEPSTTVSSLPEPEPSIVDGMPKQTMAKDISIEIVNSDGYTQILGYYDLYYRFYSNAQKSAILVNSWDQPSEIDGHYLLNFFTAQSNWNQTSYDSDIVYLPQEVVEGYLKMYFNVEPEQIRQSKLYYTPETKSYLVPMYPQEDYNSIITDATIDRNILTIYYETYNDFKEGSPVLRQGHVTIDINLKTHLKIWKYVANKITYDSEMQSP